MELTYNQFEILTIIEREKRVHQHRAGNITIHRRRHLLPKLHPPYVYSLDKRPAMGSRTHPNHTR